MGGGGGGGDSWLVEVHVDKLQVQRFVWFMYIKELQVVYSETDMPVAQRSES